jgi:sugar/nucleoside kinase (ribokinase family)
VLCAVGDLVEDVVAHLEGPVRLGADAPARVSRHRGGSAANVAAVAARLTGRARFVGAIGPDPAGDGLLAGLAALGVDCRVERQGRTGTVVAVVSADGERSFLTDRGAAPSLSEVPVDVLDGVELLHVPGYGLAEEPLAGTVVRLARAARDRGVPVTVDPSSTTIGADLGVEPYRELIATLDPAVLLPNRDEAEQLDLVARPLAPVTVVTSGPGPAVIVDAGERREVEAHTVHVHDTTGAGDAFDAAFLSAWVSGASPDTATEAGHATAARVIGGPGADWWDGPA